MCTSFSCRKCIIDSCLPEHEEVDATCQFSFFSRLDHLAHTLPSCDLSFLNTHVVAWPCIDVEKRTRGDLERKQWEFGFLSCLSVQIKRRLLDWFWCLSIDQSIFLNYHTLNCNTWCTLKYDTRRWTSNRHHVSNQLVPCHGIGFKLSNHLLVFWHTVGRLITTEK